MGLFGVELTGAYSSIVGDPKKTASRRSNGEMWIDIMFVGSQSPGIRFDIYVF